ncbi:RDD family protein [Actinomyces stomatis]|uniref:RDD family protein n=1 Tax=Actinomyces stomatis TaxID=3050227 RepID=UPI00285270DA|nr:RDD family protein [Actinomyces sp. PK606]
MTITADARSSASTAADPPASSHLPDDASQSDVVSPYGMMSAAPGDPHGGASHGGAEPAVSRGSSPGAAEPDAHTPSPPHRRLPPAPVRARVVAGVIDLVVGSLLVGGLTTAIWQVSGRPALTSGLIAFGVIVGARWLTIAATGWSLGGRLLRIRMLGARNQAPSPLGSFLHADLILAVSITTLGLGTIALMRTAAADPEGRGWHDKLSGMALLNARRAKRPNRPAPSAAEPERRPVTEPASTAPRAATTSKAPQESSSQDIGEAWDAARRASFSSSPSEQSTASQEPAATPPSQATEVQDESASRRRHSERAERKAEKKAGRAAKSKQAKKRGSRPSSTRARTGQEAAQDAEQATSAGAQSAVEAGIVGSPGGTAHPTTSDPVSSSIRRPRPARPGRPARHAGRALTAGPSSRTVSRPDSATATAAAPRTSVKATKAATVSSSSSAKSAASAGPAIVDTDAEAVAAASATPMDPQTYAAMAATQVTSRPVVEDPSRPSAGPVEEGAVKTAPKAPEDAASPAQEDAEAAQTAPVGTREPASGNTAPSTSPAPSSAASTEGRVEKRPVPASSGSNSAPSRLSSQMDGDTATLDVVEDAPPQSTDGADGQGDEAEKPSAESSKTAADSEASQSSTPPDATSTPQVPRSKATKPVTSQTMEPRHAHAQRWRNQSGHTGKKTSGSSAAPAEDQRESVSQPGVPRRESLFTTERQRFASGAGPVPEVAHTFDTSSILPSGDRNTQALIDSVPWSSVPTSVDAATVDSLPEGAIVSDDGLPQQPEAASTPPQRTSPMDLTNPATVPGGVPASSEGSTHPTVRSHRSHARTSADSATSAAAPEASSPRRSHASHRFQGPGIPSPADGHAAPDESRSDAQADEAGASRRERPTSAQGPTQSRTSVSRRSASSMPEAAASTSAPAGVSLPPVTPVVGASAQAATPSLPSASSAAPALSVRLVPLLGGNPILIHEPTVVGRDPDNISAYPGAERVALDDPTRSVSKTHAAIFPLLDGVWVTDLHSTNGTRVEYRDGRTVEAIPDKALSALEGSTIFFGRVAFKVEVV